MFLQLEAKESKLSSSMNSIKTFWSPELKKERALRKDEGTKMSVWKEQYKVVQEETQVGFLSSDKYSLSVMVSFSNVALNYKYKKILPVVSFIVRISVLICTFY